MAWVSWRRSACRASARARDGRRLRAPTISVSVRRTMAGIVLDAPDQVARHALGQAVGADQHVHALGRLRQEHRGLAGRVAAAHHDHLLAGAQLRLHEGGAVVNAGALEPRQVVERRLAVLGAGGDDDGARRHAAPPRQSRRRRVCGRTRAAWRLCAMITSAPNFCAWRIRAARQLLARDAGRKAEVVLDLRARAGLPARRAGLDHQHVQALRRGVHRRRQPRGSGADDDHVAHLGRVDRGVEAEAVGDLPVGRVAQHHVAATDQHRHVRSADVKPVEQILDVGIAVEVDVGYGWPLRRQELLDAQGPGAMGRPDEHHVAEPARDQLHPAQDEGAHDDLAQLARRSAPAPAAARGPARPLRPLAGARPDERPAPREHVDLAGELTRPVHRDQVSGAPDGRTISIRPSMTTKNGMTSAPGFEQHLARPIGRRCPCAAMRAICAGVSVGNIWSMRAVRVSAAAGAAASLMAVGASSEGFVRVQVRPGCPAGCG